MASKKLIKLNLAEKLKNKAYRLAFFRARAQDDTAANIRSLREKRELPQTELAKLARMKQSAISRIEQAEYSSWTYRTLQRVAEALDARLVVIFEPAEDVIARYKNMENFQSITAGAKTSNQHRASLVHEWQREWVEQGSTSQEVFASGSITDNSDRTLAVRSETGNKLEGRHYAS